MHGTADEEDENKGDSTQRRVLDKYEILKSSLENSDGFKALYCRIYKSSICNKNSTTIFN